VSDAIIVENSAIRALTAKRTLSARKKDARFWQRIICIMNRIEPSYASSVSITGIMQMFVQ